MKAHLIFNVHEYFIIFLYNKILIDYQNSTPVLKNGKRTSIIYLIYFTYQ